MSVFDRHILIDNVFAANARVNARNKQIEEINRRYSKWEVIHNLDEIGHCFGLNASDNCLSLEIIPYASRMLSFDSLPK